MFWVHSITTVSSACDCTHVHTHTHTDTGTGAHWIWEGMDLGSRDPGSVNSRALTFWVTVFATAALQGLSVIYPCIGLILTFILMNKSLKGFEPRTDRI